jgi:diadenosine tetraphosphate (Ap4A) HIT family hydrolase
MVALVNHNAPSPHLHLPPSGGKDIKDARPTPVSPTRGEETGSTLVIAKTHATELYQLSNRESTQYLQDMVWVAKALDGVFHPRKMSYECLGNTVAHLHWHLFPRYDWDPNPKSPVWEQPHTPKTLTAEACVERIAPIRQQLR